MTKDEYQQIFEMYRQNPSIDFDDKLKNADEKIKAIAGSKIYDICRTPLIELWNDTYSTEADMKYYDECIENIKLISSGRQPKEK